MGQIVEFASNGGGAQGYLATPAGSGPGVLVIQEWWGLVDHIKDVADRFAAAGFVALAPDLYHGQATDEPDEAGKLMMSLKAEEAARDMQGAVAFLRAHPSVEPAKVGCVGFCMGGGLTFLLATKGAIDAAVPFYGPPPEDADSIACPVQAHFAAHDDWAKPPASLIESLRERGVDAELHVYEGTEHAFFNDARPEVYVEEAAGLAWERTLAFFRRHLA